MNFNTVKKLRRGLDVREISAEEVAQEYISFLKEKNGASAAFCNVFDEKEILETAKNAQNLTDKGETTALTAIPAAVSDNILTSGQVTACGSKMLADFIPPFDAEVVETLKKSESLILGKADTDEFGITCSQKQGAAVSAGLALFCAGTDSGAGFAALSGVTALRPTFGRVSRHGLVAFASSFDQISPIAKTAEDCGMVLNAIANKDSRDVICFGRNGEDFAGKVGKGVKGLKIAVFGDENSAAKELQSQGATLINLNLQMPELQNYAAAVYSIISSAEATSNLSRYDGINYGLRGEGAGYFEQIVNSRNRGFTDETKRRILFGNFVLSDENYNDYFKKALALRQKIKAEYAEIFKTADVILTANSDDSAQICAFSVLPSLAGLPSISTCGVSLTANRLCEETIIGAADCLERILKPELF